ERHRPCVASPMRRSRIGEAVADPWLSEDVLRRGRVRLNLLSQRSDQHSQVLGLIDEMRPPNRFEDGPMGHHAPWGLRQKRGQLEFVGGQPCFFPVWENPESFTIDGEPA